MDMKKLLEAVTKFSGEEVGQKPGDQWKGTDKAPPGKKLVGASESVLKDLSKGVTPKTKEQELAEMWANFNEDEFGVEPKRPGRKSDRPQREYTKNGKPSKRYTPVKEGWGRGNDRVSLPDEPANYYHGTGQYSTQYNELYDQLVPASGAADTIEGEVLRAASKIVYRHYNDGDEFNHASFGQLVQYIGKVDSYDDLAEKATLFAMKAEGNYHPNPGWDSLDVMEYGPEEDDSDDYEEDDDYDDWSDDVDDEDDEEDDDEDVYEDGASVKYGVYKRGGSIGERKGLIKTFDTKEEAQEYAKRQRRHLSPGERKYYKLGYTVKAVKPGEQVDEDLDEARADQVYTVNIVRRSSFGGDRRVRPTSGTLPELIKYFGYTLETGKSYEHERGRKKINMNPKTIESLVDNLNNAKRNAAANGHSSTYYEVADEQVAESDKEEFKSTYKKFNDKVKQQKEQTKEGWESGPEERAPRGSDPDAGYDDMRQQKADAEAQAVQAKRPQKKYYTLSGRGPNQEPNYAFPGEYSTQDEADAARKKLMADPKTPNPRDIGISVRTRYLDEGVDTPLKDKEDYEVKRAQLQKIQLSPGTSKDPELKAEVARRMAILMKQAKDLGIEESRAHKVLSTWFKARELQDKFSKGELNIPTPQERQASSKKQKEQKKKVDEYGANNPPQGATAASAKPVDPKQAQAVQQATNTLKAATGSTVPTTNLAKAIDAASQGKSTSQQDMKALEPLMKDVATIAQTPQLAGQLKSVLSQVQQVQQKQST